MKKNKQKKPKLHQRIWRRIELIFDFFGQTLEKLSRKWRLSISFKITFTFVVMVYFIVRILESFGSLFGQLFVFVGLPLVWVFGNRAVKYLLQPIDEMNQKAKAISGSDLSTRLDVREAQDELRDMAITFNSMLERIERSMTEQKAFISHASHELRTPLAVIDGYGNLLDRWGKDDPAVRDEAIEAIKREAAGMKSLVEKLLLMTRMERGGATLEHTEFDVQKIIHEVVEETQLVSQKDHRFLGSRDQVMFTGDIQLIKELFRILMDNAEKYTPQGGEIRFKATALEDRVKVTIQDSGQGIEQKHLPHLFDAFYRADDSRTRATGGTGLGLSIARQIVEIHHGTIRVTSAPGEGTLFTMEFPNLN